MRANDDDQAFNLLRPKEEEKNLFKNCYPITLLPIFSKNLGMVMCNAIFNYFFAKKPLNSSQPGFVRPKK